MKETRKIFLIVGDDERKVKKVLEVIDHFEATVAKLDNKVDIDHVIECNKNVALESKMAIEDVEDGIIAIYVGDYDENNVIYPDGDIKMQFEVIADKYDIDIGDYIEDGPIKQPSEQDCILCKIYNNREQKDKKPMDMVIYESENFYVCPAKGALVPGYLMICPKEHILSMAALPENQRAEFEQVIIDVSYILRNIYKTGIMMFEHGSGVHGMCKHEKSIVHAHLHILPTEVQLSDAEIMKIKMHGTSFGDIGQYSTVPYFWYINQHGKQMITADPEVYIPRQYARQILAESLGIRGELWNWRKNDFKNKIDDSLKSIAEYLKRNHYRLPIRIQQRTEAFLSEMTERNAVL
jgi:diadenosine tetraphosphate (Ap4A) HIT family hydrolase